MKTRKVKKQLKKLIDTTVTPIGDMPVVIWANQFYPVIKDKLNKLGFSYNKGISTNGILCFKGSINPWHMGYNKNGELRFCDAYVYKVR